MVYEMEGKGKEERGAKRVEERGEPTNLRDFLQPSRRGAALSQVEKAEKYKTTLLRIGTCHSINLSAADSAAGCCEPPPLSPPSHPPLSSFRVLSLSFSLPVHPHTHFAWLSLYPSILSLCVRIDSPGEPASPTERAHTCDRVMTSSSAELYRRFVWSDDSCRLIECKKQLRFSANFYN